MAIKKILWVSGAAALVLVIALAFKNPATIQQDQPADPERVHGPHLVVEPSEYDFGKIKQSGGIVTKEFRVFNNGSENVSIEEVLTSCSCTHAEMDKKLLSPGERGTLTVSFDPNYHYEDDGRFFRTATITSNVHGEAPEVKIFVEVDYDLGKDALKFKGNTE